MACINPDGSATPSARSILRSAVAPHTPEELASATGLPLYRVRSSLRELVSAGLLSEQETRYVTTEKGRTLSAAGEPAPAAPPASSR